MGSPSTTTTTANSNSADQPPVKPNPFRPSAVIATVFGAIGTGATIVGGGILLSYHDLTVDDEHRRRVAGIVTVVIGALMIPPTVLIGAYDAYRYWKWRQWMKAHTHTTNGVTETNDAPVAPVTAANSTTETTQHNEPTQQTTTYDYPLDDDTQHSAPNVQPVQVVQIVTVS